MVAQAQSVSKALGVPLYRAGDKIARAEPPTPEDKPGLEEAGLAATAAAAAARGEERRNEEEYDAMVRERAFEVGVAEYREYDSLGDEEVYEGFEEEEEAGGGSAGGGGFAAGGGRFFQAGVAMYEEDPAPAGDDGTPEVRAVWW